MTMKTTSSASVGLSLALSAFASCSAFLSPLPEQPLRPLVGHKPFRPSQHGDSRPSAPRGEVSVGLFRDLLKKLKGDENEEEDKKESIGVIEENLELDREEKDQEATPIFAAQYLASLDDTEKAADSEAAHAKVKEAPNEAVAPVKIEEEILSPISQAEKLRAQAARIRLEADKRQVELTLEKISKLNIKLERMKCQEDANTKDQKSMEEELQRLKSQLITDEKGAIKYATVPVSSNTKPAVTETVASQSLGGEVSPLPSRSYVSSAEMDERVQSFRDAPEFMKVLVAKTAGFRVDGDNPGAVDRLDATDIIRKLCDDENDYMKISINPELSDETGKEMAREMRERAYEKSSSLPVFSNEEIKAKVEELEDIPKFLRNMVANEFNETQIATMLLEEEWQEKQRKKKGGGLFGLFGGADREDNGEIGRDGERMDRNSGTFGRLFSDDVKDGSGEGEPNDLSFMMESLFPKSTRKEEEKPDSRQVNAFMNDIVAPTKAFTPESNPISVPGGWIIRGNNECKTGDELVEKLDRRIANNARLREKISFFLLKDPFPDMEDRLDPLSWPQVLFVAGPDVAREPAIILRTAISSIGIATVWYGSIYPFLANSKLLDRATEQMELADAGMPTDLSWLSEMSIPLFLCFLVLQIVHEIAHQAVAKSKNFDTNIPTLVPSVISGITNSITSLTTSPKNKQDLIDFAVAGPLAGMIGSVLVLCYGLILTATADSATVQSFPGLPLAILRQSSLGGGIIDLFLGNGVLNVPASAEGEQALASTLIALHPFAVAGFFSLLVNALALVPAGRTDGGRISMALVGRSGSQAVTFMSLAALFILGISQSDLLLFFFGFVVLFQSELEIPMRNEVDDVDISRVVLASFSGFLMLLTLIPM